MVASAFEPTVLAFIEVNGSYLSDKPETAASNEISAKESQIEDHPSHSRKGVFFLPGPKTVDGWERARISP